MTRDEFRDEVRNSVLSTLDKIAEDNTGDPNAKGWRDEDLGPLFKALDVQAETMAKRLRLELTDD